jgi:hypothetical protein
MDNSIHKFKLGVQEAFYLNSLEDRCGLYDIRNLSSFLPAETNRLILSGEIMAVDEFQSPLMLKYIVHSVSTVI